MSALRFVCFAALLGTFYACKEGNERLLLHDREGGVPSGRGAGGERDGAPGQGSTDGSIGSSAGDGGSSSGGPGAIGDGGDNLILPDGSVELPDGAFLLPDGEVIDRETAVIRYDLDPDFASCDLADANLWMNEVEVVHEGGFTLVPGFLGFGLSYRSIDNSSCGQNVEVMAIPSTAGFGTPKPILPTCHAITDVSLAGFSEGWQLLWIDNMSGSAELSALALDGELNVLPGSQRRTLTSNQSTEMRPIVRSIRDRPLAAWIERNGVARRVRAQWLDGDATAVDIVGDGSSQMPDALALSEIGLEAAAVAWVGPLDNPGVWLQPLNEAGMPTGPLEKLTSRVGATTAVDVAGRMDGGMAAYSIEIDGIPQVRLRRLDAGGRPIEVEKVLVGPPLRAQGASIAALGAGYVIAYRALPGGSVDAPEIRLTFVARDGNPMRDESGALLSTLISPATIASARTQVAVSVEGQIMLAWLDSSDIGDNNLLRVARRRLDCP